MSLTDQTTPYTWELDRKTLVIALGNLEGRLWTNASTSELMALIEDHGESPVVINLLGVSPIHSGHVTAVMAAFAANREQGHPLRCVVRRDQLPPCLRAMERSKVLQCFRSEQAAVEDVLLATGVIAHAEQYPTLHFNNPRTAQRVSRNYELTIADE
ncbi:MAG: hypothetical protein KDA80_01675 [Planctomycetaceae bacterium]|nr:hypothetical protein [Planctomycetaceae bacterium]